MSDAKIIAGSWLLNPDASPVAGGALLVRDGVIAETGTLKELKCKHAVQVLDYPGCVLIPGFVNAHTHLELTHFTSWKIRYSLDYNPSKFTDWIIQLIKISRGLTPEDYPPSLHEGIRMCLESGTTAIGEIVTNPALAEHYLRSSLGGRLYFEVLGQSAVYFADRLTAAVQTAERSKTKRLSTGLSPHSPYTIAEEYLEKVRAAASVGSLPLAIHLSESRSEVDFIYSQTGEFATEFYPFVGWERFLGHSAGCSSTELLDRYGLLTPETLAVHCVHLSSSDAAIIKERGAHIVLCPRSNELLDVGRAPVSLFRKLAIPLALGTDSLASNNSLSMWDELRFALDTFPNDLSEPDMLRMVTIGGAEALGIDKECGTLTIGKRADLQVVTGCSDKENRLIEQVVRHGQLREVFVGGVRSCTY